MFTWNSRAKSLQKPWKILNPIFSPDIAFHFLLLGHWSDLPLLSHPASTSPFSTMPQQKKMTVFATPCAPVKFLVELLASTLDTLKQYPESHSTDLPLQRFLCIREGPKMRSSRVMIQQQCKASFKTLSLCCINILHSHKHVVQWRDPEPHGGILMVQSAKHRFQLPSQIFFTHPIT